MTFKVSANLEDKQGTWFRHRIGETHQTATEILRQIVNAYIDFEKSGYLGEDGNKIRDLETQIQLKERLRQVEAGRYQDRLEHEKELAKLKEDAAKQKSRDRAVRNQPRVDWGNVVGGSGDSFMLGDE
jgi:hypothetical protein